MVIFQKGLNENGTNCVIYFVIQSECRQTNPEKRNCRRRISDQRAELALDGSREGGDYPGHPARDPVAVEEIAEI